MFPRDIGGLIAILTAVFQKGYAGGDFDGSAIDLIPDAEQQYESFSLYIFTKNGTAGDVVDLHLEGSTDDGSTWSDLDDGEIPNLEDAADKVKFDYDAETAPGQIRVSGDSADQTVGSSIDVVAVIVLGGAHKFPIS